MNWRGDQNIRKQLGLSVEDEAVGFKDESEFIRIDNSMGYYFNFEKLVNADWATSLKFHLVFIWCWLGLNLIVMTMLFQSNNENRGEPFLPMDLYLWVTFLFTLVYATI